jgi:Coenzyme PQQ synthesis protein D (PqqD)
VTRPAPPGLDAVLVHSARIVGRKVAGQYILVPLAGSAADIDSVYNLNPVATFIWEQLDGHQSGREIVRSLQEAYSVEAGQAAADYLALVGDLLELGALQPVR